MASSPNTKFNVANRITFHSNLIKDTKPVYVAKSAKGTISILSLTSNHTLVPAEKIAIGMPMDSRSMDSEGDVFVTSFPDVLALLESLEHPEMETKTASAISRISTRAEVLVNGTQIENAGYEVTKVLEDIKRRILPGRETTVHDVKTTDNLGLGRAGSGRIIICKDRARREL